MLCLLSAPTLPVAGARTSPLISDKKEEKNKQIKNLLFKCSSSLISHKLQRKLIHISIYLLTLIHRHFIKFFKLKYFIFSMQFISVLFTFDYKIIN